MIVRNLCLSLACLLAEGNADKAQLMFEPFVSLAIGEEDELQLLLGLACSPAEGTEDEQELAFEPLAPSGFR